MPASEAQILANRANSALAKGPATPEGKARSRQNALKHGLTGAGVVLPNEDAEEVERMVEGIQAELNPAGPTGHSLARRVAVFAVRMERCVYQETAALSERIRKVLDEFQAPDGVDPEEAERLRAEAGRRAMFDPSPEACLARRYEAAAEGGFFKALKELRQLGREPAGSRVAETAAGFRSSIAQLGSFLQSEAPARPTSAAAAPTPLSAPSKPLPAAPKLVPDGARLFSGDFDPFGPPFLDVPTPVRRRR